MNREKKHSVHSDWEGVARVCQRAGPHNSAQKHCPIHDPISNHWLIHLILRTYLKLTSKHIEIYNVCPTQYVLYSEELNRL